MADNGRTPDLDAIARSDRLLDALAAGQPVRGGDPADRALTELLAGWRDELRWPPATGLIAENQAVAALERGRARPPQRPRRGLALAGTVAATVLGIGGFGAVLAAAHPGDALYGLRSALLGEPASVRDDKVVLAAQTEFAKVQQLIADGQWEQAKDTLAGVNDAMQNVNDPARKQDLVDQWNQLNVKVENQDPEATVPPSSVPDPAVPPELATPTTSVTVTTPGSETSVSPGATSSSTPPATTTAPSPTTTPTPTPTTTPTPTPATTSPTTTPTPSTTPAPTTTPTPAATTAETTVKSTAAPSETTPETTQAPRTSAAPGTANATTEPAEQTATASEQPAETRAANESGEPADGN